MTKITQATGAEFVPAQKKNEIVEAQKDTIVVFVNKGAGAEKQKPQDYNIYGKDFANFSKFKGNDKHDAMRLTNACANDVKKAYMQLQHEFPDVVLEFDEMPDPQKCGKGREGFFTYQQQLDNWKDFALSKIEAQRELSTKEITREEGAKTRAAVAGAAAATIANDDLNTAIILEEQQLKADELKEAVEKDGAATRSTVRKEGENIKEQVREEAQKTRDAVFIDGAITRINNRYEHARTRTTVRQEADETRAVVREEAEETRDNADKNTKKVENTVREEGQKTRDKVDEAIEIDDPTGTKRAIHKAKKLFR